MNQQNQAVQQIITVTLENGGELSAPLGVWLTAILSTLSTEQRNTVNERVEQLLAQMQKKIILPKHFVMNAETGFYRRSN